MREGRKWKVQIALISQSLSDFSEVMIEFATSIFIMDAGPEQAIKNTTEAFGLTESSKLALKNYVTGPKSSGTTLLAQISTKGKLNTQILTLTLGPIELWSFNTTMEDTILRNSLYQSIGPKSARYVLAKIFPSGSCTSYVAEQLSQDEDDESGLITDEEKTSIIKQLSEKIVTAFKKSPELDDLVL